MASQLKIIFIKFFIKAGLSVILAGAFPISIAGTILVNSAADFDAELGLYNTQSPENKMLSDGECTLIEAVREANWAAIGANTTEPTKDCPGATMGGNEIHFSQYFQNIFIKSRSSGQAFFDISSDIHIIGPTIIDGGASPSAFRLFHVRGSSAKFKISKNLSLQNSFLSVGNGAAILVDNAASLTVDSCTFFNNKVDRIAGYGGAIASGSFDVRIENSWFFENDARQGGAYWGNAMVVLNTHFKNNLASESGGALHISVGSPDKYLQEIRGSLFEKNVVYHPNDPKLYPLPARAGAIFTDAELQLSESELRNNKVSVDTIDMVDPMIGKYKKDAEVVLGGALVIGPKADADSIITRTTFYKNQAGNYNGRGGAFVLQSPGLVDRSSITQNKAADGSAFLVEAPDYGRKVVVVNTSIFVNQEIKNPVIIPGQPIPYTGGITVSPSPPAISVAPVEIVNSFLFGNNSINLYVQDGGIATLTNTAIGIPYSTLATNCKGNIVDGGSNIQSDDLYSDNFPGQTSCPNSIPLIDGALFQLGGTKPSNYLLPDGTFMTDHIALPIPGSAAESAMKGKGDISVCNGIFVLGETQTEQNRPSDICDIGPENL